MKIEKKKEMYEMLLQKEIIQEKINCYFLNNLWCP